MISPKYFLALVLIVIAITRGAVILTSHDNQQIDLSIYQETGELVVNGIDPYDFESNKAKRDALRSNRHGYNPDFGSYDYYVSANLPASTVLYGLIEFVSGGNLTVWRLVLALGDIAIALAAYFFLQQIGIALDTLSKQITFSLAVIYYPSQIYWGLIVAEDKQFQTALMLLAAGLLVPTAKQHRLSDSARIGLVGALSIMFKAFGIFLLPLAMQYFARRRWANFITAACVFIAVVAAFAICFNSSFISLMLSRVIGGSTSTAVTFHGSPWLLLPASVVVYARPALCVLLGALVLAGYLRQRIDLLNCCAAACLIFATLWIVGGSMDRMNIAMIFALFALASMSVRAWQTLTLFNFVPQVVIYGLLMARAHQLNFFGPETPDAIATAIFVILYFFALFRVARHDAIVRA